MPRRARACPFCARGVADVSARRSATRKSRSIARLAYLPPKAETDAAAANFQEIPKAKFEITKVLKGESELGDVKTIETVYFGDGQVGNKFLVMGIDPPMINWSTPIAISDRGEKYIDRRARSAQGRRRSPGVLPGLPGRRRRDARARRLRRIRQNALRGSAGS